MRHYQKTVFQLAYHLFSSIFMQVPFLNLPAQHKKISSELEIEFRKILRNCSFCSGPAVESFENNFNNFIGVSQTIGVNSGTSALHLSLLAYGIGAGDEVIVPAMTFLASLASIEYAKAKPVVVDIEPDTYCLDPQKVEAVITSKTKAIMAVHLYGHPADMLLLRKISEKHGLILIEDSAQAHDASLNGISCGVLGDIAAFSFYPGKNLGACGEAGAITLKCNEKADLLRSMRDWGQQGKGNHVNPGFNYRMDGMQGAFLSIKLKYLREWTNSRIRIASKYLSLLAEEKKIKLPSTKMGARHVYHIFAILVPNRDLVLSKMKSQGIDCGIHYPIAIHQHPSYKHLGFNNGDFPVAENVAKNEISLPIYPELSNEQQLHVVKTLREIIRHF